ncbi:hypothetical protein [uncultured Paenibacillus sp.]|uniref:hypothetical protein n=1 Tax=uncultured Paenibacillus sp. TaxID=227322 RepID=UPI0015A88865|nr:hypothetical protein [uncultured Paenibacillus sp.]
MSEKVTIPAEVADAIEKLRKGYPWSNECIIELRANGGQAACRAKEAEALRSIPFDTLLAALVNGYEREQTEEERAHAAIRKLYVRHALGSDGYEATPLSKAHADGINFTLNTLGIRIEGVNA